MKTLKTEHMAMQQASVDLKPYKQASVLEENHVFV